MNTILFEEIGSLLYDTSTNLKQTATKLLYLLPPAGRQADGQDLDDHSETCLVYIYFFQCHA